MTARRPSPPLTQPVPGMGVPPRQPAGDGNTAISTSETLWEEQLMGRSLASSATIWTGYINNYMRQRSMNIYIFRQYAMYICSCSAVRSNNLNNKLCSIEVKHVYRILSITKWHTVSCIISG